MKDNPKGRCHEHLEARVPMRGIWNKVLRVNLSKKTTHTEEFPENFYVNFIGGDGFAGKIIYDEVRADVKPFEPDNRIVFAAGPFQGTGIAGDAKFCISTKSPLTKSYANSMAGGNFGPTFKRTGYDALIIQGKADAPVYLWIHDRGVEILNGRKFWGMDAYEAVKALKDDVGERRASVATIGPAGEELVAIACVVVDGHSFAGRCGVGAVMGSKNLKAVVVHGTKSPSLADPNEVARLRKELGQKVSKLGERMRKYGTSDLTDYYTHGNMPIKYWVQDLWEEGARKLGQPAYNEALKSKPLPCLHCPVACHRHIKVEEPESYACEGPGPEYEAIGMLGMSNLVDDVRAVAKANDYCNRLGIDVISAGAAIGFSIECYERGFITKNDTDGLELRWGDGDLLIELVKQIGLKRGFGALFAKGTLEAAKRFGKGAEEIVTQVRGLDFPCHDPRLAWSMVPNYATCTRGACHCKGNPVDLEFGLFTVPELGFPKQTKFFDPQDKADLAIKCQNLSTLLNSLSLCMFMLYNGMTLIDVLNSFNAITGLHWSIGQLMKVGERSFNLQRLINIRDGKGREYDRMPKRVLEPAKSGFRKGKIPPIDVLMDEYYELRGWDKKTGIPKREKLIELGMSELAP